ncbi:hypothetical protein [Humibacter sp.]|uniref:hypothetical protein n=1 Tax=Humibacter sp. TaxID=1940291 RepID=UPI003F7EE6DD
MFGNSDVKAMRSLAEWYWSNTRQAPPALIEARPAPVFMLDASSYYSEFVIARSGSFVLVFDDSDPGSIPAEQRLGSIQDSPATVFERVHDTTKWFAENAHKAGDSERGTWYANVALSVSETLGRPDLRRDALIRLLVIAEQHSLEDPASEVHHLGVMGQRFEEMSELTLAARARIASARAADAAQKAGDSRFDLNNVIGRYKTAIVAANKDDVAIAENLDALEHRLEQLDAHRAEFGGAAEDQGIAGPAAADGDEGLFEQGDEDEPAKEYFEFQDLTWCDNGEIDWGLFVDHAFLLSDEDDEPPTSVSPGEDEPLAASLAEVLDQLSSLPGIAVAMVQIRGRRNRKGKLSHPPEYDAIRVTFFEDADEEYVSPLWADVYPYSDAWCVTYTTNPDDDQGASYPDDQATYLTYRATALEVATVVVQELLKYARNEQFLDLDSNSSHFSVNVGEYRMFTDFERGRRVARACQAWLDAKFSDAEYNDEISLNEFSLQAWVRDRDREYVWRMAN